MITKDTLDYVIRAKTGWGGHGKKMLVGILVILRQMTMFIISPIVFK